MKKNIFVFALILVFSICSAQNLKKPDYIHSYERIIEDAQIAFDDKNYGDSLTLAEKAKNERKLKSEYEVFVLENAFKPAEVKKQGNSISESLKILQERENYEAINIIERNFIKYGKERFNDSKSVLIEFLRNNVSFPEADFLIGKIYCLEGEYEIAYKYFFQAYENSANLDVPDEKYSILYKLADVSKILNKDDKYEEFLLLILSQSSEFKDESLKKSMLRTVASTKTDCLEKFFTLYRASNYSLLKAYFSLSNFYIGQNEKEKALVTCQFGVITAYSKIVDVLKKRNADFEVTDIVSVFKEIALYPDIIQWGIENNVWEGFYNLADLTYANNDLIFCIQLFNVLKDNEPERYWKNKAAVRLDEITP